MQLSNYFYHIRVGAVLQQHRHLSLIIELKAFRSGYQEIGMTFLSISAEQLTKRKRCESRLMILYSTKNPKLKLHFT